MHTQFLTVPDGTIAFDDQGEGPLILCVPAGGDTRAQYRFLTPQFVAAGYRVVTMDLRGQGESSPAWPEYTDAALASDMLALIRHLEGGPARIIATSKATGGALRAAVEAPSLVSGLALIGVMVAAPRSPVLTHLMTSFLLHPLWGVALYDFYFPKLYPKARPADFAEQRAKVKAMLKEPGRLRALRQMFSESGGATYARHAQVEAPVLILMGSRDPDVKRPEREAYALGRRLPHATVQVIEGAGHHLAAEMPEVVGSRILAFLATIEREAVPQRSGH
ncbi:MAG TPA: alpha/beta fold hydrolase [Ktedonobacterales bacterium]|nr:alpha/beta fold hydrolase [Ktedonobacterales bacterium]